MINKEEIVVTEEIKKILEEVISFNFSYYSQM